MEPRTIIIIDDSETARALAADAVELLRTETGLGFTTIETSTGRDGLQRLREQRAGSVALVVLDIHLPWEDVDGRMLASLIREQFPTLPILPFTGDRDSQTAAQLQALGFPEPVIKPVAPEVLAQQMRTVLMEPPAANDVPLQPLLAAQARRMVRLLEHRATYRLVQLALVARNHLVLAGLQLILTTAKDALPLEIVVSGTGRDAITPALQAGRVDLLGTAPDAFEEAASLADQYRLPLLIYSTAEEAEALLPQPYSLVVGPSSGDVLAEALRATLAGEHYREPHVEAALSLSARERSIIQQLMRGATSLQIASAVGLSDDRLRHVIGELYERLGVERQRSALASWGHEARLDRF
ncbi:MAG TPA: response regulator [Chloroflexaceae bacterium]|nr:response regulator [Chloroflexaceae bacterium]